jgi:hypothetical protein
MPSSLTRLNPLREKTWNPPESVRMGPSQPINRWTPPKSRIRPLPGRSPRWNVLDSTMVAPASFKRKGGMPFTEARVPTGMNMGVSTSPWGVVSRPRRPPEVSAPRISKLRDMSPPTGA